MEETTNVYTAKQIGARIKERRKELGISMETLGNALGVNKSTIQRYEARGIDSKKNYILISIADALDTTVEWLTGLSYDRNYNTSAVCKSELDKHITSYISELIENVSAQEHQQMLTSILGCFIDMFSILSNHFGIAMKSIADIENDMELKSSLTKYALNSGDISEKVYRQEIEQPIEEFKQMADCMLHIFDNDGKSHIAQVYEIRNTARQNFKK